MYIVATALLKPLVDVAAMFTNYSALPLHILNLQDKPQSLILFLLLDPLMFVCLCVCMCVPLCALHICVWLRKYEENKDRQFMFMFAVNTCIHMTLPHLLLTHFTVL